MSYAVEVRNIHKRFGSSVALGDISLNIPPGNFVVLLGPSGSGKTTLLNIIGGFLEANSGQILIAGKDITSLPPAKRPTATVFQDYALFPHMNVLKNVVFGLAMKGITKTERLKRAQDALELVGLADFAKRSIHELSGGQKQRIALARSLVIEPQVLLLDEPLGALDLNLRKQMQHELVTIQKRIGTTFIHVTHDQEEAMSIADMIVVMDHGKIEDCGAPERIYLKPASKFSATFMGDSNLIRARVIAQEGKLLTLATPFGQFQLEGEVGQLTETVISLRPEQISLSPQALALGEAQLERKQFLGSYHQGLFKHSSGDYLKVQLPQDNRLSIGSSAQLYTQPENLVLVMR